MNQNPLPALSSLAPALPVVRVPVVQMSDQPMTGIAISASAVLAPRPNPTEPNARPTAADISPDAVQGMSMILKVLVMPDGTIADATVLKSSGRGDVDTATAEFVRSHWHFLPATLNGDAIQYWTSVAINLGS